MYIYIEEFRAGIIRKLYETFWQHNHSSGPLASDHSVYYSSFILIYIYYIYVYTDIFRWIYFFMVNYHQALAFNKIYI